MQGNYTQQSCIQHGPRPAESLAWQAKPKHSLHTDHAQHIAAGLSCIPEKQNERQGVGLSGSSCLSLCRAPALSCAAAAQLPGQGHGSQSSWPRLRADPTQVLQPWAQVCTALSQRREHLPPTGSLICVFVTAQLSHEPLQH